MFPNTHCHHSAELYKGEYFLLELFQHKLPNIIQTFFLTIVLQLSKESYFLYFGCQYLKSGLSCTNFVLSSNSAAWAALRERLYKTLFTTSRSVVSSVIIDAFLMHSLLMRANSPKLLPASKILICQLMNLLIRLNPILLGAVYLLSLSFSITQVTP